jgi:hypothetical protein
LPVEGRQGICILDSLSHAHVYASWPERRTKIQKHNPGTVSGHKMKVICQSVLRQNRQGQTVVRFKMELVIGIEPMTPSLRVTCSTS